MDLRLIYALILTLLPVTELRAGLPLGIIYGLENNIPVLLIFIMIISVNILLIFIIFYFLDNLHNIFMKTKLYRRFFNNYLKRIRKKINKFEKNHEAQGFLALVILVAIPLPGTGAWTGSILSWILGLERKKSILSISIGVIIAGILILLGTLGFLRFFPI